MITQADMKTKNKEELVDAILKKHETCQLEKTSVEKNVDRFIQLNGILRTEILINFEFIKTIQYSPIQGVRIDKSMREAFLHEKWQIATRTIRSNAMANILIGLRKLIEKTDKYGKPTQSSKNTSSIVVVTQKFKNLLNPHIDKDKGIQPFLEELDEKTHRLRDIREVTIDPIVDQLLAHTDTIFYESNVFLPAFNKIEGCIDLCQSYCQSVYSFYLDRHIDLEDMKSQVARNVSNILESLRIKSEYSDARDDIREIIFSENPLSEKNEKIAKRLMEIIEPRLYEAMCIMEKIENG